MLDCYQIINSKRLRSCN